MTTAHNSSTRSYLIPTGAVHFPKSEKELGGKIKVGQKTKEFRRILDELRLDEGRVGDDDESKVYEEKGNC